MNKPRLIQIIKRAGLVETRKEAMDLIKSGRVKVDGHIVTDIYYQTRPEHVTIDGKKPQLVLEKVYFLLNKPSGYSSQKTENPNVLQLFKMDDEKVQNMLHTIGRLDVDTTGLLIVTNDGSIMHQILQPEKNVWKTYIATVTKELTEDGMKRIRDGIVIEVDNRDYLCLPSEIKKLNPLTYELKIKEGKTRQVKKMLAEAGTQCIKLHRQAIGGLALPHIKEGEYKEVTKRDLERIFD